MYFLVKSIKCLPHLKNLTLDFHDNKLGENEFSLKYLEEVMKKLSKKIQSFKLNLSKNNLRGILENMN